MDRDAQQTQLILDTIPSYVFLKDTSNRILQVNQAVIDWLGLPREQIEGRPSEDFYPEDADEFYADDLEVIRTGRPKVGYVERVGGHWLRTDKIPIRGKEGEVHRVLAVATDITEMVEADEARKKALRLLETTGRIANVGGWEFDLRAKKLSWSAQVCRIHEVPEDYEPTLEEGINFYVPSSRDVVRGLVETAIATGKPWDVELLLRTAKGNDVWVRAIGQAEVHEGECVRLWGTLQDINERKLRDQQLAVLNKALERRAQEAESAQRKAVQAEAELAQVVARLTVNEERYRTLFEESPVMHGNVDPKDATIKDCNQLVVTRLGYEDKSELIGKPIFSIYSDECQDEVRAAFADFLEKGEVKDAALSLKTRTGETIPVILNVAAVRDEEGNVLYSSSTWSDVTALTQANRDLEEFAYVASHDLKAPLRAISHLATWLEEDLGGTLTDSSEQHLAQLKQRVRRMDGLLDDLLAYSRANAADTMVSSIDLGELVTEIADLFGPQQPAMICLDLGIAFIEAARTPLETILRNLVGNAIKHHDTGSPKIEIAIHERDGHLEVAVSDDGPGIPAELRDRAFRMFHTLRPRDEVEGSGMGLALVKRLVENAGGTIRMEAVEPHGLRVFFTWPLTTRPD
ncbi:MAG: PAS domain S-box protein [Planctomycetota bacterium]